MIGMIGMMSTKSEKKDLDTLLRDSNLGVGLDSPWNALNILACVVSSCELQASVPVSSVPAPEQPAGENAPSSSLAIGAATPIGISSRPVFVPEHRVSCHRCGNIRKRKFLCSGQHCPHIFCGRCADKMREEHGNAIFDGGCPVCREVCCCSNKTPYCDRKNHCYRKCPATKTRSSSICSVSSVQSSAPNSSPTATTSATKTLVLTDSSVFGGLDCLATATQTLDSVGDQYSTNGDSEINAITNASNVGLASLGSLEFPKRQRVDSICSITSRSSSPMTYGVPYSGYVSSRASPQVVTLGRKPSVDLTYGDTALGPTNSSCDSSSVGLQLNLAAIAASSNGIVGGPISVAAQSRSTSGGKPSPRLRANSDLSSYYTLSVAAGHSQTNIGGGMCTPTTELSSSSRQRVGSPVVRGTGVVFNVPGTTVMTPMTDGSSSVSSFANGSDSVGSASGSSGVRKPIAFSSFDRANLGSPLTNYQSNAISVSANVEDVGFPTSSAILGLSNIGQSLTTPMAPPVSFNGIVPGGSSPRLLPPSRKYMPTGGAQSSVSTLTSVPSSSSSLPSFLLPPSFSGLDELSSVATSVGNTSPATSTGSVSPLTSQTYCSETSRLGFSSRSYLNESNSVHVVDDLVGCRDVASIAKAAPSTMLTVPLSRSQSI